MKKIMTNDLVLKRKLELHTWRVPGKISRAAERSEIQLILTCLNEGNCTAQNVAKELLFDEHARLKVAESLLEKTRYLGLSEWNHGKYRLTDKGEKALREKKVFIPEEGVWEITFCGDTLLPFSIVDAKPFKEPSATDEAMRHSKDKTEERKKHISQLPASVLQKIMHIEGKPNVGGDNLIIESLAKKGEKVTPKENLVIEWNVTKKTLKLLNGKKSINQLPLPDFSLSEVWQALLEQNGWLEEWRADSSELEEFFDEVDESSRQSMRADLEFENPRLSRFGGFESIVARDVWLRPKTNGCAQQWALWKLTHNVRDYATKDKFEKWCNEAKAPFSSFPIELPTRDELAASFIDNKTEKNKKAWHLVTASDWNI